MVLVGAQGLGKTMLAKNIAHAAVMGGYSAIFITAADLLLDLASQESTRALARRVKHYARVACLCIDEIGYLEYEQRAPARSPGSPLCAETRAIAPRARGATRRTRPSRRHRGRSDGSAPSRACR